MRPCSEKLLAHVIRGTRARTRLARQAQCIDDNFALHSAPCCPHGTMRGLDAFNASQDRLYCHTNRYCCYWRCRMVLRSAGEFVYLDTVIALTDRRVRFVELCDRLRVGGAHLLTVRGFPPLEPVADREELQRQVLLRLCAAVLQEQGGC
jgi:hypothetical protein